MNLYFLGRPINLVVVVGGRGGRDGRCWGRVIVGGWGGVGGLGGGVGGFGWGNIRFCFSLVGDLCDVAVHVVSGVPKEHTI